VALQVTLEAPRVLAVHQGPKLAERAQMVLVAEVVMLVQAARAAQAVQALRLVF